MHGGRLFFLLREDSNISLYNVVSLCIVNMHSHHIIRYHYDLDGPIPIPLLQIQTSSAPYHYVIIWRHLHIRYWHVAHWGNFGATLRKVFGRAVPSKHIGGIKLYYLFRYYLIYICTGSTLNGHKKAQCSLHLVFVCRILYLTYHHSCVYLQWPTILETLILTLITANLP